MNTTKKLNAAFWVKDYGNYLYRYASRRVSDQETANDLVQETFLAALEKAGTFEGKCSELTWLRTILSNKIIDHYRKRSSGLNALLELRVDGLQPDEFAANDRDKLGEQEFYAILDCCLKRLPELWMTVFRMKHLENEKSEVICSRLQLTSSNYWVIAHRARLRVREYLRSYWQIDKTGKA